MRNEGVPPSLNNNPIIIAGPTGAGKSTFAVDLALQIGGELVCADAFQVYHGMALLTAQPTETLSARVPHHLYGMQDPAQGFDAAAYSQLAKQAIATISGRGQTPILVGGSGLYLKALTDGLDALPPTDPFLRTELSSLSLNEALERLRHADPSAPSLVDCQNPRRVTRALEIVIQTGRPLAESRTAKVNQPGLFRGIVLARERFELWARIESNVRAMFSAGVVDEVARLGPTGPTASRAIGLQQIRGHLAGQISREEAISSIVVATRRYAKRQLTWFRHQSSLSTLMVNDSSSPSDLMGQALGVIARPA